MDKVLPYKISSLTEEQVLDLYQKGHGAYVKFLLIVLENNISDCLIFSTKDYEIHLKALLAYMDELKLPQIWVCGGGNCTLFQGQESKISGIEFDRVSTEFSGANFKELLVTKDIVKERFPYMDIKFGEMIVEFAETKKMYTLEELKERL